MKLSLIILIVIITFTTANAQKEIVSDPIGNSVDTYLSRTVPFGFSGAVLVAKGEEILLNKGYGLADRKKKIKNTVSSIFSTGSLTKQFTAAGIMKLEMMGKVHTDDKLSKYFKNLPSDKKDITLRHLLTHTSGLPLAFSENDFRKIGREEFLEKAINAKLEFETGSEFNYSNVGYTLLAMIIENETGASYEAFLQKYLFSPAGMTQTGYNLPKWDRKNFVHIYNGEADNGTTSKLTKPTWHLIGNGGILSTTHDMLKWIIALKGSAVLSKEAKQKMFTPFKNDYGFGWDVLDEGNLRQHNGGSFLGNGAELRWFVEDELLTIVFTNSTLNGKVGFAVVRNEVEALTMGDEIPLPPEITTVQKDLNPYRGKYQLPSGDSFEIEVNDGTANILVESQELLDLLIDPENYTKGGINVELNNQFEQAFSNAFNKGDYSGFDFTGATAELKKEILNELNLEGIENPKFKVVRTMPSQRDKNLKITKIALNGDENFEGESLMLSIVTNQEKYAGLGADFGFTKPITLRIFPNGGDSFQLYDLQSKIGAQLRIKDEEKGIYTVSVNNIKVSDIKKIK